MDLRQLESFVTVVEQGSMSRAAVALHLAQPSVSRQVALLEQELGQRLLERNGRGVQATQAGLALLTHARAMLASAQQARRQIHDLSEQPSGRVVVGLPHRVAAGLCVPLVEAFRRELPQAMISVVEGLSLSLRESLINGRIDLALLFDPTPSPMMACERLMRERLMLVSPKRMRLPPRVPLADLALHPMILPSVPNPIRERVDSVLLPRKIELRILAEVGAVHSAMALVEQGVGCSILPESARLLASRPDAVQWSHPGSPVMWNELVLAMPTSRPLSRLQQHTVRLLKTLDFRHAA